MKDVRYDLYKDVRHHLYHGQRFKVWLGRADILTEMCSVHWAGWFPDGNKYGYGIPTGYPATGEALSKIALAAREFIDEKQNAT